MSSSPIVILPWIKAQARVLLVTQTQADYLWTWRFALQETLAASQGQGFTRRIRFFHFRKS
jgi:hypothetical protein